MERGMILSRVFTAIRIHRLHLDMERKLAWLWPFSLESSARRMGRKGNAERLKREREKRIALHEDMRARFGGPQIPWAR